MRAVDLIFAKRQGETHAKAEIEWLIAQYVRGTLPDYQLSAWLMAVFFRGLNPAELSALVNAMMRSGEVFDWKGIKGVKADKHSTGGVGDKVSLILAPLAAACGLVVPMVSGRGLGHSGGTLDKLEAIKGFNVNLSRAEMGRVMKKIGVSMIGQTEKFVPADKKLYALRDVTATVESIPLISASIMSKKMGEGCDVLVLDIKCGNGAFMTDIKKARELGRTMVAIGKEMGRKVSALITDMNQPLGIMVGNANEVAESIECLKGGGPKDLMDVTYALTARMLVLAGTAKDTKAAQALMEGAIKSGAALDKFRELIKEHGGDAKVLDDPKRLPGAPKVAEIVAPRAGYFTEIDTRTVGVAACVLGAGRQKKEDTIDHGVGLEYLTRIGQKVEKGQPIFRVNYRKPGAWEAAKPLLEGCFKIGETKAKAPKLIYEQLD